MQASATAVMTAFVAGLKLAGWSLREFRRSPWRNRAASASREAVVSQVPRVGTLQGALLGTPVLSAAFFLAALFLPLLFPFDLEKYLRFHYRKTREQTVTLLDVFEEDGKRRGLPIENIQILLRGLRESG